MARPQKNTIDYFSHDAVSKKTLFILEQRFGNDGYAFWFKLLELLCTSQDHYIDTKDVSTWEFLVAKTRVSEVSATEIMATLAKLGAIDPELWKKGVIWSDGFIQRIEQVYKKRGKETPPRPSFCDRNSSTPELPTPETPQSKVKEIKVKETKEEEGVPDGTPPAAKEKKIPVPVIMAPEFSAFIEYCEKRKIQIKISQTRYLEMRDELSARGISWWKEVQKCIDWLYDNKKEMISAKRIRKWMNNSLQWARDREIKNRQAYNDRKMSLLNKVSMPQPSYEEDLLSRAESGERRAQILISPSQ